MGVCKVASCNDPHYQYHVFAVFSFCVYVRFLLLVSLFGLYSLSVRMKTLGDSVIRQPFKSTNILEGLLFLSMVSDADKISDYFISLPL